ncbi:LysM peptidoglycan-binding domain-containing protein [Aquiflexum sp. LQ15W]|uniref:lytic transglycosylase domain-containing protein n=1 Tax=Cognataquiflexum nitidum TaxID=2922272 RepID=UPI001F148A88|nr:lytic transglycosylase domain-containing protein [Cognataquiflexum nitidum]MCH6199337.1 LysM peptidoglycan-binding domain-containing protein [Cognataquiflexum nitidum]
MKNLSISLTFNFLLLFFIQPAAIGQELFGINNATIEEETIAAIYHFDHIPDFTYNEVAKKIKEMDTDMPFELNERIFSFINYFVVRNREYTKMVIQRKDTYFPLFEQAMVDHDMPEDIKYLSIIESGLNPKAKSRVGALGLWQFMPATGKMYGLDYNKDVDLRMDPELSSDAAAKYLKSLYRMFGDWELALAAYNCGPGNVRKAIRRSGGKKTFWGVYDYLPKETRSYVPQFQAMMYVIRYAEDHNLILEQPSYPIAYEKINFNQELDLEQLAAISGICIEDLEYLNPAVQNRLIPISNQFMAVNVPKSKVDYITENKEQFADAVKLTSERSVVLRTNSITTANITKPAVASTTIQSPANQNKITYVVKSGDVLGTIAQKHGTTVTNIKNWNNLSSNTIRVGQKLAIYKKGDSFQTTLADNTKSPVSSPQFYTVQPGDSLWIISKKFDGLTIDQIKKLNNLNSNQIKPGQKLKIG